MAQKLKIKGKQGVRDGDTCKIPALGRHRQEDWGLRKQPV